MSSAADLPSLIAFHSLHIELAQLLAIEAHFGSFATAVQASDADWRGAKILRPKQQTEFLDADRHACLAYAERALAWGEQPEQSWVTWWDESYPAALRNIDRPPPILGVRGDVDWLSQPQIAIVGSRHASQSGVMIAKDFAQFLSAKGITITSGLALGIDAAAHQGALQSAGKTVAVVATGLDRIYPAANQQLGRQIAEQGAMISEFPLDSRPVAFHFPQRNRIISGLSLGTLVIEAALKSGSLITARLAMEQGKEVFAVPGSIHNPQAKGCHQLIKQGAKLVESGQDIFDELAEALGAVSSDLLAKVEGASQTPSALKTVKASQSPHAKLLKWIEFEPISLDELAVLSKMPVSQIQAELLMLELSGEVEKLSAGRWQRIR